MIHAFKLEFSDKLEKMPLKMLDVQSHGLDNNKDMVSLAGLDNTDVAWKQAILGTAQLAKTVRSALMNDIPPELRERVTDMKKEMEDCKTVLRQH